MTDDKKSTQEFGDIDWDEALSEWEHTSFDPEVAKDSATAKPGALAGASRPLYRPPTASPAVRPRPAVPPVARMWSPIDDEEGTATRIAHVPEELLEDRGEQPEAALSGGFAVFSRPTARPPLPTLPADEETGGPPSDDVHQPFDLTPDSPRAQGPALLAPKLRHYDPNDVTVVGSEADLADRRSAILTELSEQRQQTATNALSTARPPVEREPLDQPGTWANERPAGEWLSAATRDALAARGTWLEEEAQSLTDKAARSRGLLVCSEIFATVGDRERAQALAAEARDVDPSLALARRQARALMPFSLSSCEDYVEAIDAEASLSPDGASRAHSTMLAAEALRAAGQDEAASHRLESVARMSPGDVRAIVLRAARAISGDAVGDSALRPPESPELTPIADAIATCLRLRGVEREGGSADPRPTEDLHKPDHAPFERSPSDVMLLARRALDQGEVAEAAPLVAELAAVPELAAAAKWLSASLGATRASRRADAARWLRELAERGDQEAHRALVARYIELGDGARLGEALDGHGPFTSAERVTISTLAGLALSSTDPHLDATASAAGMQTLATAITALTTTSEGDPEAQIQARTRRTSGSPNSRALVRLARLLAASAPPIDVERALEDLAVGTAAATRSGPDGEPTRASDTPPANAHPAEVRAVALEMAMRAGRISEVSRALDAWGGGWGSREDGAIGAIAAGLVAERGGDRACALDAFKAARIADPGSEAALRAIASLEQIDLVAEMNLLADDLGDDPRAAVARLEAVARGEGILPEPTRAHLLEQAHRAAPTLPIASFLAERIARRTGDIDEVLRWVRERRASSSDPIEAALDAVREALLIADRDPQLAGQCLQEAHRVRPEDVALRELYERVGSESPEACAAWREQRAAEASGNARTLFLLEAAREYERAGDEDATLRCTEAAGSNDDSLEGVAYERAELHARRVARLAEQLLAAAKGTDDARLRREAYERLAVLDSTVRNDSASALLWHRAILDETPGHAPSLRHLEQHLIGEGRNDELEPIATAIAGVLRGTGSGECTAHAELAARLRLRGADAHWNETRDLVELAAGEADPSLWALRMLQAHSRAGCDDASFLSATLRLLERTSRPAETATLLVLGGEVASRLGRLDEARSLLGRATVEDPGDCIAWTLLADVCRRSGDGPAAGEALEALARSALVNEHQLQAWYDAGRVWLDDVRDEDRAVVAFEAAATLDVAYKEVFDCLSQLYVSRKMHAELAILLERRISVLPDPEERVAMEVRRGNVLLAAADGKGARSAFEAALAERPENSIALSAFAELCLAQFDWEGAEQALVRLARLLPTTEEQCAVYARLGDLYAHHLLNLSRAEVAFKEVLKCAPEDVETTEKLIDVYKRQSDGARAAELQQELIAKARSPEDKRKRFLELATIYEHTAHDHRRTEQSLEAARREFPQDVGVLRALAEFYVRHHQAPAFNILLDRAGGDARRALAAGRISPALFDVIATVFDLRDNKDAARVTRAMLAALDGLPAEIPAAGHRAFDPALDEGLAPEGLTAPLRTLLSMTGDALDQVSPVDLRALKASPLSAEAPLARLAADVGFAIGLGAVQVLVSQRLGAVCIPVGSSPPVVVVGEGLTGNERVAPFLVLRALKLVQAKGSALARSAPADLAVLVSAWLKCFNPSWQPQGVNLALVNAVGGRLQAVLTRNIGPAVAAIALEAAGEIGTQAGALGGLAVAWADRVALLSLGDPNAALDAIAAAGGDAAGAPRPSQERAAWIARTIEARDLIAFAVTDTFAEARARLGIGA